MPGQLSASSAAAHFAHFGPLSSHPMLAPLGPLPQHQGPPLYRPPPRYGSGAGSAPQTAPAGVGNPRPRFRSRSFDATGPRTGRGRVGHSHWNADRPSRSTPAGPQETNDWLDALNKTRNAIDTLRSQQLNQAAGVAMTDRRLADRTSFSSSPTITALTISAGPVVTRFRRQPSTASPREGFDSIAPIARARPRRRSACRVGPDSSPGEAIGQRPTGNERTAAPTSHCGLKSFDPKAGGPIT